MQKKDKIHIRFNRDWNPKRIAGIFLVEMLRDYLREPENIKDINDDNFMQKMLTLEEGCQKEALLWLADLWGDHIFSFNRSCKIIGVSPDVMRARVFSGKLTYENVKHMQILLVD